MFSAISRIWHRQSPRARELEEAVRGARIAGVPTFRESLPKLNAELRRARRYERPLTVLAIGPGSHAGGTVPDGTDDDVLRLPPPMVTTHTVFFLLGSLLRDSVRETDVVVYSAEHHLYAVLLPESGEREARGAVERISRVIYDRTQVRLRAGAAEFPRDGLTVEDLFEVARNGWRGQVLIGQIPFVREANRA